MLDVSPDSASAVAGDDSSQLKPSEQAKQNGKAAMSSTRHGFIDESIEEEYLTMLEQVSGHVFRGRNCLHHAGVLHVFQL